MHTGHRVCGLLASQDGIPPEDGAWSVALEEVDEPLVLEEDVLLEDVEVGLRLLGGARPLGRGPPEPGGGGGEGTRRNSVLPFGRLVTRWVDIEMTKICFLNSSTFLNFRGCRLPWWCIGGSTLQTNY